MTNARLSRLAQGLQGSAILRVAAEVRALVNEGRELCDLTVGDFSPRQFPIPDALRDDVVHAIQSGETNYPQSPGMDVLRKAVSGFLERRRGLKYPAPQILIASGARPLIYTLYRVVVDPGDRVVYHVPSWNNNYYTDLVGGQHATVTCDATTNFQPRAKQLRPLIRGARLLALNSPLNPTGTLMDAESLADICDMVLEENARRGPDERPLFLLYDQVYWMLTFGGVEHADPVSLRPDMAAYTVLVDALSKAFAATGLRVGWAAGPADVISRMADVSSHVGAWAPRAEQIATTKFLANDSAIADYHEWMLPQVQRRLSALADAIHAMREEGLPVDCTEPQGAIYLSAQFALHGARTPEGKTLGTNDDVRRYLLEAAGMAAVPFQAFGANGETGWFRLSVGAVSMPQIDAMLPRLRAAIDALEFPVGSSAGMDDPGLEGP